MSQEEKSGKWWLLRASVVATCLPLGHPRWAVVGMQATAVQPKLTACSYSPPPQTQNKSTQKRKITNQHAERQAQAETTPGEPHFMEVIPRGKFKRGRTTGAATQS
jgi:hypothetical protein